MKLFIPLLFLSTKNAIFCEATNVLRSSNPDRDEAESENFRSLTGSCVNFDPANYDFPGGFNDAGPLNGTVTYQRVVAGIAAGILKFETPIAIRLFSLFQAIWWNCVAAYDTLKHDALYPHRRPVIDDIPSSLTCSGETADLHTTAARAQCLVFSTAAALDTLTPESNEGFQQGLQALGGYESPFPLGLPQEVKACDVDSSYYYSKCLNDLASDRNYEPSIVGAALALDAIKYALSDGWNMDGSNNGQCEYNCRPYADTTSYYPRNLAFADVPTNTLPWDPAAPSPFSGPFDTFKYLWQPLLEDDGRGFFYRQEHVTPHIGTRARPRILSRSQVNARQLPPPRYNYRLEAKRVLQRLASLTDAQKMQVEFFDNKVNVIGLLAGGLVGRYSFFGPQAFTFERILLFAACFTAGEEDAIILAWKEKVRHDRVRTTTVVQQRRYGTPPVVTTWAGPFKGTQTFKAQEFQPYIRVMPHAEYPSGSGCLCQSTMESTLAFMKVVYNDNGEGFVTSTTFLEGTSQTEPGAVPFNQNITIEFTMEGVRNACGQSRLDGGMHFTAAVPDSYKLCGGFGKTYEKYIRKLLGGSTDLITTYTP